MARRADGSYDFGDFDAANPKSWQIETDRRRDVEQQAAQSLRQREQHSEQYRNDLYTENKETLKQRNLQASNYAVASKNREDNSKWRGVTYFTSLGLLATCSGGVVIVLSILIMLILDRLMISDKQYAMNFNLRLRVEHEYIITIFSEVVIGVITFSCLIWKVPHASISRFRFPWPILLIFPAWLIVEKMLEDTVILGYVSLDLPHSLLDFYVEPILRRGLLLLLPIPFIVFALLWNIRQQVFALRANERG